MKWLFVSTWCSFAAWGTVCLVFGPSVQERDGKLCEASYRDGGETEGAGLLQPRKERGEGRPTSSPQYLNWVYRSEPYWEQGRTTRDHRHKWKWEAPTGDKEAIFHCECNWAQRCHKKLDLNLVLILCWVGDWTRDFLRSLSAWVVWKNLKFCSSVYIFSLMFLYVKMLLTSGPFEHSLTPDVINLFFFWYTSLIFILINTVRNIMWPMKYRLKWWVVLYPTTYYMMEPYWRSVYTSNILIFHIHSNLCYFLVSEIWVLWADYFLKCVWMYASITDTTP